MNATHTSEISSRNSYNKDEGHPEMYTKPSHAGLARRACFGYRRDPLVIQFLVVKCNFLVGVISVVDKTFLRNRDIKYDVLIERLVRSA